MKCFVEAAVDGTSRDRKMYLCAAGLATISVPRQEVAYGSVPESKQRFLVEGSWPLYAFEKLP